MNEVIDGFKILQENCKHSWKNNNHIFCGKLIDIGNWDTFEDIEEMCCSKEKCPIWK